MPDRKIPKDANAVLDYAFDWSEWLQDGESLTASDWSVSRRGSGSDADDLSVASSPSPSFSGGKTKVWLENGVPGEKYLVTNSIDTDADREDDRSFVVTVTIR